MSSPSAYQCLFCNHLNPAGASFCNECGSQLHLQQCDLCGSINKRSARACYKCGAAFTFGSPLGTNAAMLEHRTPAVALEHAQTTLPESVVEALGARRAGAADTGVRGSLRKSHTEDAPDVDSAETVCDNSSAVSSAAPGLSSAVAAPAASRFNYRHALALLALVSLLVTAAMLFMSRASGPGLPVGQGAVEQSGGDLVTTRAQPSSALAASDSVARPPLRAPTADDVGVSAVPPSTAPSSEIGDAQGNPAASSESAGKACQPAIAALGLCDGATTQEKR